MLVSNFVFQSWTQFFTYFSELEEEAEKLGFMDRQEDDYDDTLLDDYNIDDYV